MVTPPAAPPPTHAARPPLWYRSDVTHPTHPPSKSTRVRHRGKCRKPGARGAPRTRTRTARDRIFTKFYHRLCVHDRRLKVFFFFLLSKSDKFQRSSIIGSFCSLKTTRAKTYFRSLLFLPPLDLSSLMQLFVRFGASSVCAHSPLVASFSETYIIVAAVTREFIK